MKNDNFKFIQTFFQTLQENKKLDQLDLNNLLSNTFSELYRDGYTKIVQTEGQISIENHHYCGIYKSIVSEHLNTEFKHYKTKQTLKKIARQNAVLKFVTWLKGTHHYQQESINRFFDTNIRDTYPKCYHCYKAKKSKHIISTNTNQTHQYENYILKGLVNKFTQTTLSASPKVCSLAWA